MSVLLAESIQYIIQLIIAVFLLYSYFKKKKGIFLWGGIILIVLSVFQWFLTYQKQSRNTEKKEKEIQKTQTELKEKIASARPLSNDSTIIFDSTFSITILKNFIVAEQNIDNVKILTIGRLFGSKECQITLTSGPAEKDLNLSDFIKQREENIQNDQYQCIFSENNSLNKIRKDCIVRECKVYNKNKSLTLIGYYVYFLKNDSFFRIAMGYSPNNAEAALATLKIYNSIKIY